MSKFVLVFAVFSVLAFASITAAKNCQTLNGTWYNQRGDKLYLEHRRENRLVGEYWPRSKTEQLKSGKVYSARWICEIFLSLVQSLMNTTQSHLQPGYDRLTLHGFLWVTVRNLIFPKKNTKRTSKAQFLEPLLSLSH